MRKNVGAMLIALILGGWSLFTHAGYIDGSGREWRSPSETVAASPTEVGTPGAGYGCDPISGRCSGRLGGTGPDVDGWIWASLQDVVSLFIELGVPGLDPLPTLPFAISGTATPWGDALIDADGPGGPDTGAFDPTAGLLGTTSTTVVEGSARTFQDRSYIFDVQRASGQADTFTIFEVPGATVGPDRGLWLYRAAAPVSAGSTLGALALGAAALAFVSVRARRIGARRWQHPSS